MRRETGRAFAFIQIVRYRYGWIHCRSIRECTLGRAQIRAQIPIPLPNGQAAKTQANRRGCVMLPMQHCRWCPRYSHEPTHMTYPGNPDHGIFLLSLSRSLSIFLLFFHPPGVSLSCLIVPPSSAPLLGHTVGVREGSKDCWMWSRSSYMPCGVKSQNSVARPLAQLNPASSSRGGRAKNSVGLPAARALSKLVSQSLAFVLGHR